ncbi:uncharacterized protein [Hetaerina americana]|uniref:uncharacterized protein n=1 Tax=Hetaerina americana TaxID=62018 RepID=UPI003A7F2E8C
MDVFPDLCDKEVLKNAVIQELRKLGFKNILKQKKNRQKGEEEKKDGLRKKLFNVELHSLCGKLITSKSGVAVEVPSFIVDACEFIEENISTEGLFRKAGSNARQKEIKISLEEGNGLKKEYHVIDIANTLKHFFRELPEPLIPYSYHEAFSRCLKMQDKVIDCLLLCCLLLPMGHLSTLIYFTQFLRKVSDCSDKNKMDITNLSIIMAPTLMPVEGRITENIAVKGFQLSNHVKVIELLIKNSHILGELPENLIKRLPSFVDISKVTARTSREDQPDGIKKKRRSESMTRVLSGFRRMVRKSPTSYKGSSTANSTESSDSSFQTPVKKRKAVESSASFHVAGCASPGMCGVRSCPHGDPGKSNEELCKSIGKKKKTEDNHPSSNTKTKTGKSQLNPVRRWSYLSSSSRNNKAAKKIDLANCVSPKKDVNSATKSLHKECSENGMPVAPSACDCHDLGTSSEELVEQQQDEPPTKVQRGSFTMATFEEEYQEIKNKVSAIENQLMEEFGRLGATSEGNTCPATITIANKESNTSNSECSKGLDSVQSKYEKTLEEAERFSDSSADQLAKRLSRELKIRWSAEHKIIRSPSARKIGSLRRRSRDSLKQQKALASTDSTSQSICNSAQMNNSHNQEVTARSGHSRVNHSSLKRGRPNTILTGLRHPSPGQNSDGEGCLRNVYPQNCEISLHLRSGKSVSSPQLNKEHNMAGAVPLISSISGSLTDMGAAPKLNVRKSNTVDFHSPRFLQFKEPNVTDYLKSTAVSTPSQLKRASSFQDQVEISRNDIRHQTPGDLKKCESYDNVSRANVSEPICNASSETAITNWHPAAVFLSDPRLSEQPVTGRESVAKLRAQNAGKVLANVKLFEHSGRTRSEKALSLSRASSTNLNPNFILRYKLNASENSMKNVQKSDCHSLSSDNTSAKLINSYKDRTKPRRSSSDSASHVLRQGDLRRHHDQLPGHGKRHQRKHRSFSPFRHKKHLLDSCSELSKENITDPFQRLTDNLVNEYNNLKDIQNSRLDHVLTKLNHPSPLKDSNRILLQRQSPAYNSVVSMMPGGLSKYSNDEFEGKIHRTPSFGGSPLIKQPLTSGHTSLRPMSSLRKKTGKVSPMKGIHLVSADGTPKLPSKRQSPRLLLRSRLMSNACM